MKLKILILFSLFSYIYSLKIGVIGPTGAVGKEILNSLSKENIQFSELKLFGSNKSNNKGLPGSNSLSMCDFSKLFASSMDVLLYFDELERTNKIGDDLDGYVDGK